MDLVTLKKDPVHYMDVDCVRQFSSVSLIAVSGDKIRMNPIILAAFNRALAVNLRDDEDENKIITQFSTNELEMLVAFCHEGVLPAPMSLMSEEGIPEHIASVFEAFGIYLDQVLFQPWTNAISMIVKPELPSVVNDQQNNAGVKIKSEKPDFASNDDFLDSYYGSEDLFDEKPPKAKVKKEPKKRGRKRKQDYYEEDFVDDDDGGDDDEDELDAEYEYGDFDNDNDNDNDKSNNGTADKYGGYSYYLSPSKRNQREQSAMRAKESRIKHCKDLQARFKGVNVHFPSDENADMAMLETYELPCPLESYIRPPRPQTITESNSTEDTSKPFHCEYCPKKFSAKMSEKEHVIKHHQEHYDCTYCNRSFAVDNSELFRKHMFKHEHVTKTTEPHECIQCGFSNFSKGRIIDHMSTAGPYHDNQCTQCPDTFATHRDYMVHVDQKHANRWLYKCGQCDLVFETKEDVTTHRFNAHVSQRAPVKPKVCDICGKELKYGNLERHLRLKHDQTNDNVPCHECGKTFRTQDQLTSHIHGVHKLIACNICGMMVPKKRRNRHLQQYHTADADKRFKCETCGKGFCDGARLRDHINTHTGAKPYVCKYCGQAFASRGNHAMHERGHKGHKRSKT